MSRQGPASSRLTARRILLWPLVGVVTLPLWALLLHAAAAFGELPPGSGAATAVSLGTSLAALALTFLVGLPLAWWAASASQGSQRLLELLLAVPLLMPPLVLGLVLAYVFGPTTGFGQWLLDLGIGATNSYLGLTLAGFYEAVPYFVYAAWAAFSALDRDVLEAAWLSGMAPPVALGRIALPLAAPGLAVAAAMAWARTIGAFGAPIVLAYHPTGLPVGIWIALSEFGLGPALQLALVLVAIALPLPLVAMGVARRAAR